MHGYSKNQPRHRCETLPLLAKGDQGGFCCGDEPSIKAQISLVLLFQRGEVAIALSTSKQECNRSWQKPESCSTRYCFFSQSSASHSQAVFSLKRNPYTSSIRVSTRTT